MPDKEIIIKITNDKVWFNDTQFIDIRQTDIPHQHLSFKTYRDIYWKVRLLSFDRETGKLNVEIKEYNIDDHSSFQIQKPKKEITFLTFQSFHWEQLEPLLSSFQRIKFEHLLFHKPIRMEDIERNGLKTKLGEEETNLHSKYPPDVMVTTLVEEFTVSYNDCNFVLGGVRFSKRIKCLKQTLDFEIKNDHILPEFDHIKYWFAKRMKSKKFRAKAIFVLHDFELSKYSASSEDINYIDQDFIDGVKVQRTLSLPKYTRPYDLDKALFSSDEFYQLEDENDAGGNVFNQNEQDIFNTILEISHVRNKKELNYLSGQIHAEDKRIRFTNHPNFGFIFLAEGESNHHFIWELLNSHATYIWSIEKSRNTLDWQYKRVEETINKILAQGRETYKRALMHQEVDEDLVFNVIKHTEKESNVIDGFPKWKHRLHGLMT